MLGVSVESLAEGKSVLIYFELQQQASIGTATGIPILPVLLSAIYLFPTTLISIHLEHDFGNMPCKAISS